jgi:hypothetical protein
VFVPSNTDGHTSQRSLSFHAGARKTERRHCLYNPTTEISNERTQWRLDYSGSQPSCQNVIRGVYGDSMLIAGNGLVDVFTAAATEFGLVGGTEFVLGHGPIFCESFASVGGECVLVAVNG